METALPENTKTAPKITKFLSPDYHLIHPLTLRYTGALRYLPNINVPYCSPKEAETLEKAISYVFTDMQTRERHEHALNCYQITYKRVAALAQWLGQVINSTIARDLYEVTENCKTKAAELRSERVRLIKMRLKDITGQEVDSMNGTAFELRGSE